MSDPHVRDLGFVTDINECPLVIGVDYDSVAISYTGGNGGWRLTRAQCEEFAQLFTAACWEAARCGIEQELEARDA